MGPREKFLRRSSLFSIFFTFGLDNLGATIIFPIFAPLFLNPEQGIISAVVPMNIRAILLGFFLGAFPFSQFLFSPIVGEFADRYGRKSGLIITTILALAGYILSALGIAYYRLGILFLGRFIMGLSAANLSICLAAIADLSTSGKQKMSYFSYGSAIAGFTFVLGPFVGGKLSDPGISSFFNPAFPMWIGAGFAVINLLFIIFAFKETHHEKDTVPFDLFQGIQNIHKAFKIKKLRSLYAIYFFFLFAFNMIFQFTPAFLVQDFSASNSTIGDITALMGVCWILGTAALYRFLSLFLLERRILLICLCIFAFLCLYVPQIEAMNFLILTLGSIVILAGVIWPVCTGFISNAADKGYQGKILGISQSMQSFTMMLAPFVGGPFLLAHSGIPLYIAAASVLIAIWISFSIKKTLH